MTRIQKEKLVVGRQFWLLDWFPTNYGLFFEFNDFIPTLAAAALSQTFTVINPFLDYYGLNSGSLLYEFTFNTLDFGAELA